jgi:hypothetical protein
MLASRASRSLSCAAGRELRAGEFCFGSRRRRSGSRCSWLPERRQTRSERNPRYLRLLALAFTRRDRLGGRERTSALVGKRSCGIGRLNSEGDRLGGRLRWPLLAWISCLAAERRIAGVAALKPS